MTRTWIAAALLFATAFSSVAGAQPGANYPHLKHLERLVGHWKYVGKDDVGRPVNGEETIQWICNKNYLRGTGIWCVEGEKPVTYELTTGWDPQLQRVVLNGALSNGAVYRREGNYDKQLNASISEQTSILPNGTRDLSRCTIRYLDDDTWTASWTEHRRSGEKVGDSQIKARRVEQAFQLPKKALEEFQFMLGHWQVTGQASTGKLEGIWSLKWAPGMHCLEGDYRLSVGGKQTRSSDLYAWDAVTDEFVLYCVYQGGHIEVGRTKPVAPGVQRGPYTVDIEGKKYEGEIEIRRKGNDRLLVTTEGLADQGVKDLKLVAVRMCTDKGESKERTRQTDDVSAMNKEKAVVQQFWEFGIGTWNTGGGKANFQFTKMPGQRYVLRSPEMRAIIRWNEEIGKWQQTSITNTGELVVTFEAEDNKVVATYAANDFQSGEKESGKWRFVKNGKDDYQIVLQERTIDDKKQPDRTIRFTRHSVSEQDKTVTRREFERYCRAMAGRWVNTDEAVADWVNFEKLGKTRVSYTKVAPVADGKALEGDFYVGKGSGKWLTVWDPVERQLQILAALSDGTVWKEIRYPRDGHWHCELKLHHPDGSSEEFESTMTVSRDGDTHTYRNPVDPAEGVYQRVAR